ncbi:hypothetical protein KKF91_22420 [Myxococcota bacterium]|nr:hypothetical protein [Myxococcota bacterium]MBU1433296.1 hypothetical protein [Myxococcota bacterium]MBU1896210.1 hypothetical protein [Myxococcota bacterium]
MSRALPRLALTALLCLNAAKATTLQAFTLEDLATQASMIIEGTVLETRARWVGRLIVTDITVAVDHCYKGECEVQAVELRVLGGTVGDLVMSAHGVAQFSPDETVLLFLEPIGALAPGYLQPTGQAQGKFRLVRDAQGPVLRRDPRVARLAGPDIEAAHALDLLPLDEVLARLERVLAID